MDTGRLEDSPGSETQACIHKLACSRQRVCMMGKGKAAITKTGENDGTALHRSPVLQGQRGAGGSGGQWHLIRQKDLRVSLLTGLRLLWRWRFRTETCAACTTTYEVSRRGAADSLAKRLNLACPSRDIGGELRREGVATCYEDLRVYQSLSEPLPSLKCPCIPCPPLPLRPQEGSTGARQGNVPLQDARVVRAWLRELERR